MKINSMILGPRLSAVSWFFIEGFALAAIFFLPFSKSAVDTCVTVGLVLWLLRKFPWNERFPRVGACNAAYGVLLAAVLISFTGLHGLFKWLQYLGIFLWEWSCSKNRRGSGGFS